LDRFHQLLHTHYHSSSCWAGTICHLVASVPLHHPPNKETYSKNAIHYLGCSCEGHLFTSMPCEMRAVENALAILWFVIISCQ
jgi:hypothetical protein